ncbi:MAG: cyclase family protein [Crenarchaeota archaeon]|nr:cyclase family protein [Thermoproteota archaeon]
MLIDLSREISEKTKIFHLYPKVSIIQWSKHEVHGFQSEVIYMITHVSTHMDAPAHFIKNGKTVDLIELEKMTGHAVTIDVRDRHIITREDVENAISRTDFRRGDAVFLYTSWADKYETDYYITRCPGIDKEAAEYLRDIGAKLVGIDSPSIDPAESTTFDAHKILLEADIPIIENLVNLEKIVNKRVRYYAFPLKLEGCSASPVRVIIEM